jgi:hypothetical protein
LAGSSASHVKLRSSCPAVGRSSHFPDPGLVLQPWVGQTEQQQAQQLPQAIAWGVCTPAPTTPQPQADAGALAAAARVSGPSSADSLQMADVRQQAAHSAVLEGQGGVAAAGGGGAVGQLLAGSCSWAAPQQALCPGAGGTGQALVWGCSPRPSADVGMVALADQLLQVSKALREGFFGGGRH